MSEQKKKDDGEGEAAPPAQERRRRRASDRSGSTDSDTVRSLTQSEFGTVRFDPRGNAQWEWRVETPRRRKEDDTIDLLECLDPNLSLSEDDGAGEEPSGGFNPYDKDKPR